jgi:hypothetical protein
MKPDLQNPYIKERIMEKHFTKRARVTMTVVAVVFGLFGAFIIPILAGTTFNTLMEKLLQLMVDDPHFQQAPKMLTIWFTAMLGITFVASATLIVTAYPLSKGKSWAWAVALSCISIPTIFAVIEILPYVVHISRPPPTVIALLVGLTAFIVVLLSKKGDSKQKIARILVFVLLGVLAGHINVLTMHGFKGILDWPNSPMFSALEHAVYAIESPANLIAMIMSIVAIPLLAIERKAGWWIALFSGVTVTLVNYPTHFIRMKTSDFFVAGTLGLALVISLVIPGIRKRLLAGDEDPLG